MGGEDAELKLDVVEKEAHLRHAFLSGEETDFCVVLNLQGWVLIRL